MTDAKFLAQENDALRQQLAQCARTLREAEARLDAVFNSGLALLSICTIDGVILDVNHATLRALGLPIEALVGKHLWESAWFARNPAEAAKIERELTLHRGQYVEYESIVALRPGDSRRLQFSLRPYKSYVGTDARFLVLEVREVAPTPRPAPARAQPCPCEI
jgi:PAS domain S-box-containing protein